MGSGGRSESSEGGCGACVRARGGGVEIGEGSWRWRRQVSERRLAARRYGSRQRIGLVRPKQSVWELVSIFFSLNYHWWASWAESLSAVRSNHTGHILGAVKGTIEVAFFFSFDFRLVRFQDPLVRTTQPAFVGWIVLFRSSDVCIVAKRFCDQPNRAVGVRMGVFRLVCLIGRSASFLILIGRASPSLVRVAKKMVRLKAVFRCITRHFYTHVWWENGNGLRMEAPIAG